jgi:hypothetical protein
MKRGFTRSPFGQSLWVLLALAAAVGCGDSAMPTQPLSPTPRPTPLPAQYAVTVTLTPTEPPSGYKHGARADFVVTETGGRTLDLTGIRATSYFGDVALRVVGFPGVHLEAGQTKGFSVILKTTSDIPCQEGVLFTISSHDEAASYTTVDCGAGDWPF